MRTTWWMNAMKKAKLHAASAIATASASSGVPSDPALIRPSTTRA